jgi:2-(1,2-epoxy-1,2-dihydrophenyl)acetyl-CoA isomerase
MEYQTIRYVLEDGIAVVRLNRPDVLNSMSTQMRAELLHAIKRGRDEARVIVMTGEGRAFCAGQDLGEAGSADQLDLERTLRDEYTPLIEAIASAPIPVMAAVNGIAAGAGANIALAADIVVAAESAQFIQVFTRIGLMPDAGGTWVLPRQIGLQRAMATAMFNDPVKATDAAAWGMIWEAFPDESFEEDWRRRAKQLADGPTQAFRAIKKAIRASLENSLEAQLLLEAELQGKCGKTRDFQEGLLAFLEKRPANFEGR